MQFYSSNYFKWTATANLAAQSSTADKSILAKSSELKCISYKANAQRSYWIDAHGLQTDVVKISRLLKRADRLEQFYQVNFIALCFNLNFFHI